MATQEKNNRKWQLVRSKRNSLLLQCDYTQLLDVPFSESKKAEWQVYRQALRDITDNFSNPFEVIFPTKPL